MKKRLAIIGGIVVIALVVVGNLTGGSGGIDVTAEAAVVGTVVSRVSASGRVFPITEVKINSQVSARIERLAVREGDRVGRGDVLVELDRTIYQARVEGAQAALRSTQANGEAAQATMRQAEDAQATAQALADSGLGASQDLRDAGNNHDAAMARHRAALAQVESAQASLEQAMDDLSRTTITAPMIGTVTALVVEEGEMVLGTQMAMGTQMMAISDLGRMEVEVDVDETDVVAIEVGQEAEVEVDALAGIVLKGTVTEIANAGFTTGRGTQMEVTNFAVKVELVDADDRLRPGMSATVDIITEVRDGALNIPLQAVTARKWEEVSVVSQSGEADEAAPAADPVDEELYVEVTFIVGDDGTVSLRQVETGISSTTHVEILSGLSEGERVVTGPFRVLSRTLKDGQRVTVKESLLDETDD